MEISELKCRVDIMDIASHLGIKIDNKTKRANCPFHNDTTPSLQFSKEKQICTCFSSNCNAGTMDVIGLTEKKLNVNTHEALKYLTGLAGSVTPTGNNEKENRNYTEDFEQMQRSLLSSSIARNYLKERKLAELIVTGDSPGYNAFKSSCFNYLRGCITFALRDNKGKIVSMYGRSVREPRASAGNKKEECRHFYTVNRKGLYPQYPDPETRKLVITESIIDTATLQQIPEITNDYTLLASYGTNGITPEHIEAVSQLKELEEIIFFFDGDEAGKEGVNKWANELKAVLPNITISQVATIEGEDINSLSIGHEPEIFIELLQNRKPFLFQDKVETLESSHPHNLSREERIGINKSTHQHIISTSSNQLITNNPNNIVYATSTANYSIKGGIRKDLDSLKVTLVIESVQTDGHLSRKSRNKLDLYEDKQAERVAREAGEKLNIRTDLIENDLCILTDLLDQYREQTIAAAKQEEMKEVTIPESEKERCFSFLKAPDLLPRINDLIGKSGVVGEENNRLFLFGIASSYKMNETLHALIQGSSGSGKTHLLATIMDFMPPEDTISLTRVTESSFYNYGQYELQNKLIGMEDYDGLEEKAELAFRELQSKGMISSSTSGKNEHTGEITGYVKTVYGPIASLSATTRGEIYEDNMSRCFLVAVDESQEQTYRIIKYQNQRAAGVIDTDKEIENRNFLRNCMRLLQPYKVVNPFADKIDLPKEAHKIRRLNDLFQCYVKQITLLNQYQRRRVAGDKNVLITEKEDVKTAIEIMFDSIILKVDELDGSLRNFYEKLKEYVLKHGKEYEFEQREIRHEFMISKSQLQRYFNNLLELEYICKSNVGIRNTFRYKILYWDNMQVLREKIKQDLYNQLEKL